jgi:hypothetical protein
MFINIYRSSAVLCAMLILAGCAGMDKSQCVTADWRTIGFEDGVVGKNESAIGEYRQDCAEHGVAPNLTAYRRGHAEGAERFCTRNNGFKVGRSGASYQNSCPTPLEPGFLVGFRDGQQLYQLQRAVSSARNALDKQQRELTKMEKDIVVKTELLVADGLKKDERITLLNEIESLKQNLFAVSAQLPVLEQDIRRAEQALVRGEQAFIQYK